MPEQTKFYYAEIHWKDSTKKTEFWKFKLPKLRSSAIRAIKKARKEEIKNIKITEGYE